MTEPPYVVIAADLRRRITAGELAPGDRVPSTRELTRRWGVAMATATKAITTLRHEGLVRPVPGVGTVVEAPPPARPPRRRAAPEATPTRDRVVRTAIEVADAEGLSTLSMRRVAAELGIATMSLYRHVASKDDLLVLMIDATFGEEPLPTPPAGWRAALEASARLQWVTYRRHPWLAPAMSLTRPQPAASALAHTEWVLGALDGYGLDTTAMFTVHITLFSYVRGMAVNLESEAQAEAESGLTSDEWMDQHLETLESMAGEAPMFGRVAALDDFDLDLDALFEFGLQALLDGLRRHFAGAAAGVRPS